MSTQTNYGQNIAYKKLKDTTNYVANINLKENEKSDGGKYKTLDVAIDFDFLENQIKEQKAKGYKKLYISCSLVKNVNISTSETDVKPEVKIEPEAKIELPF